jgi:hypothetical protein
MQSLSRFRLICNHSSDISKMCQTHRSSKMGIWNYDTGWSTYPENSKWRNGSSWLWRWLANDTYYVYRELILGFVDVYPHHCPHIPFLKPRRQLGNRNKSVSTVFDKLCVASVSDVLMQRTILPAPPCFQASRASPYNNRGFCFSRRLPEQPRSRPMCELKPKSSTDRQLCQATL